MERHRDVAGHHDAGGRLHHVRRRAGGDLDRRQDHGADRVRPAGGGRRGRARAAGWRQPRRWTWHRGSDRPAAQLRFFIRPHQPVHVLVGDDRRVLPLLLLLRHRSEPGAALPDGAIGRRGATFAARQRLLEDSAPAPRAAPRRAGVRVLRLHSPAADLQHGRSEPPAGACLGTRVRGASDRVRRGIRATPHGGSRSGGIATDRRFGTDNRRADRAFASATPPWNRFGERRLRWRARRAAARRSPT